MVRDVLPDTRRRSADDRLEIVSQSVIPVVGMELGHRLDVTGDVLGQPTSGKLTVPLFRHRHIDEGDCPPEGLGVFRRHGPHVLRLRPGDSITRPTWASGCSRTAAITSATSLVSIGDVFASPKGRRIVPFFAIDSAAHWEKKKCWRKTVARTWTTGSPDQFRPARPTSAAAAGASRSSPGGSSARRSTGRC